MRDVAHMLHTVTDDALRARIAVELAVVRRLLAQKPMDKRKLYALHEPEVDCISSL
jgi:IS5 family transposase